MTQARGKLPEAEQAWAGNPTRLQIYRLLVRAGQSGLSVGTLQGRMEMAASTLSHHLKRLIEAGLVTQERNATTLVCRAVYAEMWALIGFLQDECCADDPCAPTPQVG